MRKLIRNRRGSTAFATAAALVPVIGVVALGAEAGSWYVTKQHAQNAADAAAYSGGLALACSLSSSSCGGDTHDYVYRGKEFAAQNNFCNANDTSYPGANCPASLGSNVSQLVVMDRGTWAGGAWANSASGTYVRATVQQTEPAHLAAVLGLKTVNIRAQAIAQVQNPNKLCALGLSPTGSSLWLGGSVDLSGNGCGLMSDGSVKYSSTPTVNGSGWAFYGTTGCVGSTGECSNPGAPYNYYMPPATDPLSKLDSESFNSSTGKTTNLCPGKTCTLSPNSPSTLYGNLTVTTGNTVTFNPGTYFFYNATIKINGGTVTGTGITIVLLGDSLLSISGGTVTLSAPTSNTSYPDLSGVLIDDQAPNKTKNAVTINGSGNVALGGAMYFPNVDVTLGGTVKNTNNACSEVIANTLTISGNAYLNASACPSSIVPTTQVVALVQ